MKKSAPKPTEGKSTKYYNANGTRKSPRTMNQDEMKKATGRKKNKNVK